MGTVETEEGLGVVGGAVLVEMEDVTTISGMAVEDTATTEEDTNGPSAKHLITEESTCYVFIFAASRF